MVGECQVVILLSKIVLNMIKKGVVVKDESSQQEVAEEELIKDKKENISDNCPDFASIIAELPLSKPENQDVR